MPKILVSVKVYPADLARLRARCHPGQSPAGALTEVLDLAEEVSRWIRLATEPAAPVRP